MTHPAAPSAARSATAGRWLRGYSVWKRRANWADSKGSNAIVIAPAFSNGTRVDAFGLFTGQIGYAVNNALFYLKGGAAVTADRYRVLQNNLPVTNTFDDARWGGVIGVGLEYGFAPNWSASIEYDHMLMQDKTYSLISNGVVNFAPAGSLFNQFRIRQDVDLVTARINCRWGGPIVAKYRSSRPISI